ncbi:hypothetical protein ACWDSJ_30010 [Nocardia sp. NPDC003482]
MSDESTQLSVAELLARNGQGVPTTGGGRRRRGGRGIAVTDLTGDLPAVPEGSSAHAAPEPEESSYSPASGPISFYDPLARNAAPAPNYDPPAAPVYEAPAFDPPRFEPTSFAPPTFEPPSYPPPEPEPRATPEFGWPPSPAAQAPTGGRRARRERMEALAQEAEGLSVADLAAPAPASDPPRSGRRRRREPDEETTEVSPYRGPLPQNEDLGPPTAPWAPPRPPEPSPPQRQFGEPGFDRGEPGGPPRNGRRPDGPPPPGGLPAWSARRRTPPEPPAPERPSLRNGRAAPEDLGAQPDRPPLRNGRAAPDEIGAQPDRPSLRNGRAAPEDLGAQPDRPPLRNGRAAAPEELPVRNGRAAPEEVGAQTAVWSLAERDQQLVSGPTVAGDLLREANERDRRGARRGGPLPESEHRTELLRPLDDDLDEPLDDLDDEEELDEPTPRRRARTSFAPKRSRGARKADEDANRKQWMILGGQAAGAAIGGMVLFKGFEKMWDLLPFVALLLAMVVILGLVALVRVLRRTDDILSTVIAVVVGIFVTLGPLAFLLSTN